MAKCTLPPKGWTCTREAGHDGPCAAVPAKQGFWSRVLDNLSTAAGEFLFGGRR